MLCKHPISFNRVSRDAAFPCGQCLPCRINKRRIWAHRIILESLFHDSSVFLTLTYSDDHIPQGDFFHPRTGQVYAPFSVNPEEHRLFMNKLRFHFKDQFDRELRFYMVGEYGEKTQRPHYHYVLFGYPRCVDGARYVGRRFISCRCPRCDFLRNIWGKGEIFLGELNVDSANYVAGYVTKKLTNDNSEFNRKILQGRFPEFARQSRRPGIGAMAMDNMARSLLQFDKSLYENLPRVLAHGSKFLPLGRYLTDKLHEKMEISFAPGEKLQAYERALFSMLSLNADRPDVSTAASSSVAIALQMLNSQRVLDMERKRQLFTKEKMI